MTLTNFKFMKIKLDRADMLITQPFTAKEGAVNGNGIELQLVNGSIIENTTGVAVYLNWKHQAVGNQGSEPFTLVDATKGLYRVSYPTEMLSGGSVNADIKVVDGSSITMTTQPILIKVAAAATDSTTQSENAWNDIQTILVSQQQLKALFEQAIAGVTVDSEVITARQSTVKGKTFTTLDARLEDVEGDRAVMATNLVTNGDFSNGSTGWTNSFSTLSVASNTATVTGNGGASSARLEQAESVTNGIKYYLRARARVTNSLATSISLRLYNGASAQDVQVQATPTINQFYNLSGVITSTNTSAVGAVWVASFYADTTTQNGKVMEVQYVSMINLTTIFGAGKEPTKEQMDWLLAQKYTNSWFDGTKELSSITDLLTLVNTKAPTVHTHDDRYYTETEINTFKTEVYSLLNQDRRIFGAIWNGGSSPTLTRTGYAVGLTAQIGIGSQVVVNDFDNIPIWRWETVIDALGNEFMRIPKVYIRKTAVGDTRTWEVSQYKNDGFYLPKCFWDFTNNRELDYVDVGKYQASLESGTNKLESKTLKYPLINTSIVNFRTYARNNGAGYGQFDIHVADLLQTLFIIEFATLNSQAVMPGFTNGNYTATRLAVLTESNVNRVVLANANADVFRVGQPISIGTSQGGNQIFYGRTITAINVVDASNKELVFDGTPVNITAGNMVYNTGWRSGWSSEVLAKSGTIIANDGFYPMMYRGIESLWGDVYKWVDGVNIDAQQAWVCENQDQYVSNLFTAPYKKLSYVNALSNNYISKMGMDFANPYANFPTEVSGGSTTFYSDYYYQNTAQYAARLGGGWSHGAYAGLFFWNLEATSSNTNVNNCGRLIRKAV